MTAIRWVILRSRFPFGVGRELGVIEAPDKATAEQRGTALYGAPVAAQSLLSREAAAREKLGPGVLPKRDPKPSDPDKYRRFAARKRAQHQAAKADRDTLPLDFTGRRSPPRRDKP